MKICLPQTKSAFSLTEMLSVIAVIGVISAIAIPSVTGINDSAEQVKNQRNAQNIASVFAAARAAGLDFNENGSSRPIKVVETTVAGGVVEGGIFDGAYYGMNLSAEEQQAAVAFLSLDAQGNLIYAETITRQIADTGPVSGDLSPRGEEGFEFEEDSYTAPDTSALQF